MQNPWIRINSARRPLGVLSLDAVTVGERAAPRSDEAAFRGARLRDVGRRGGRAVRRARHFSPAMTAGVDRAHARRLARVENLRAPVLEWRASGATKRASTGENQRHGVCWVSWPWGR